MSAWGVDVFENDDAQDWLDELVNSMGSDLLEATLALADSDYLEVPEGSQIVCAAYVVAALLNKGDEETPEELASWLADNGNIHAAELIQPAIVGIDRVVAAESELDELWQENEQHYEQWKAKLNNLRDSLLR